MNPRSWYWRLAALLVVAALVPACGKSHRGRRPAAPAAPGITVSAPSSAITAETGATSTFTVVLNTLPTADVTIDITSSTPAEGLVSSGAQGPATTITLTFTAANGTTAQTVTVTGQDDAIIDGNIGYTIQFSPSASTDATYAGLDPADIALTNNDNDVAAITVIPTSLPDVTEGGATATFDVFLASNPTSAVTVPIDVAVADQGQVEISDGGGFGPSLSLALNDTTPVTITVRAIDDVVVDGPYAFTIVTGDPTSADAAYGSLIDTDVADVTGNALDNDTVSIVVQPTTDTVANGGPTLLTHEGGGTDLFRVRLGTAIAGTVSVTITVGDLNEGSVSPVGPLVFTSADAQTFQTVTVTGLDDPILADAVDVEYAITLTAADTGGMDAGYAGITATVNVVNVNLDGVWTGPLPPGASPPFSAPTPTPGVALGAPGAFDDFEASDPAVMLSNSSDIFELYYRGRNQSGSKDDVIARTTSDLADFSTRTPSTNPSPLVGDGINGSWKKVGVGRPSVVRGDFNADGNRLAAPTSGPIVAAAAAGGSIDAGDHQWFVTFGGSLGTNESAVGNSGSNILTIVATMQTVNLSGIPTGPTGTTSRNIYRTIAGNTGNPLFVGTIPDNTTSTFQDTIADSALGTAAPTGAGSATVFDTYILFYSGRRSGFYDGIDWTTSGNGSTDPMLFPYGTSWTAPLATVPAFQASGVAAQFDQTTVTDPWVIFEPADAGAEFKMWYRGEDANGVLQVGYATADLSGGLPGTWTRNAASAVAAGAAGSFNERISAPTVVYDSVAGLYRMYFTCHDLVRNRQTIGYAESAAAAGPWTVFPTPILVPDSSGTAPWSDQNVFAPSVMITNSTSTGAGTGVTGDVLHLWYSGTGSGGQGIGHASVVLP